MLADPQALPAAKIFELGDVVLGKVSPRQRDDDIVIYKSVGVGLEDVALAGFAWSRIAGTAELRAA